jgi:hypothetical protein
LPPRWPKATAAGFFFFFFFAICLYSKRLVASYPALLTIVSAWH